MTIKLQKETHDQLVRSIKRYFAENTESEIATSRPRCCSSSA